MPLFRATGRTILFTHIPKSGGSSVEASLENAGLTLSFLDTAWWDRERKVTNTSSPQHLLANDMKQLFSDDFFDYKFALIRNPVDRFISAYNFNKNRIGGLSISEFLNRLHKRKKSKGDYFGRDFDNHFEPAGNFLMESTELFFLKQGMNSIITQLSARLGLQLEAEHEKKTSGRTWRTVGFYKFKRIVREKNASVSDLSERDMELLEELYKEDFTLQQK